MSYIRDLPKIPLELRHKKKIPSSISALSTCGLVRVLVLFRRVTFSCTIPTYDPTRPSRLNYFGFRRATMASSGVVHIMGCGGRMPTTQHIAVTLTPLATRRCAGSRAYDHHSQRKLMLMVPYFFVTFFSSMIIDN